MQLCCTGSKSIPARYRTCTKNSPLREKSGFGKTDLTLAALSYELAISERQLFRRIKSITGLTPNKYIRAIKLQIAREAIENGRYRTIAEVSYAAGLIPRRTSVNCLRSIMAATLMSYFKQSGRLSLSF
ncbi:helix-turn-helix domain-containing protein [Mucilaginibacter sp. UC70_90]